MKAVKTIAALIFLSALAIVLIQPVLRAGDDEPTGRVKAKDATPQKGSYGDDGPHAGPSTADEVALTARYPKRCLRKAIAATGLLAARRGSVADIGFPDRAPVARIGVSGDVAWSPSGTFLAERGGRVFDQSGNPQGALFFEPREWQWSPVADCALATTERGSLTFSIPDTRRKGIRLLNAPVRDFELSPNGRRLALVIEDRGLWIADLRRGGVVQATDGRPALVGWFSNRSVLFSKTEGSGKLRFAIGSGKTAVVRGAFAGGTLVRCVGGSLLASAVRESNPALAELVSLGGGIRQDVLEPSPTAYDGYSDAACSPDGQFIAVSAIARGGLKGPLLLLRADGTFVRELVAGRTASPTWSSDGLIFTKFGKAGRGRIWLIELGSLPAPTSYRVGAPTQYDWHVR